MEKPLNLVNVCVKIIAEQLFIGPNSKGETMLKKDLRVGMMVVNTQTKLVGQVEADRRNPDKPQTVSEDYVAVRILRGQKNHYSCWYLPNIKAV